MKANSCIPVILGILLLYGTTAFAGGAQCAAAAKEVTSKSTATEEAKALLTSDAVEATVVDEVALALEVSPETIEIPVLTESARDVEITTDVLDVTVVEEAVLDTRDDSSAESIEETK